MNFYETHVMKDPQLPFIFHYGTKPVRMDNTPRMTNWHENIELLYIVEGSGTVASDTESYLVQAGDCVAINANCMHSIYTDKPHFCYHCLIIDRSFCIANHFDTNLISFEGAFHDESIAALFLHLAEEYIPPFKQDFRVQRIRALVLQIMAELCTRHSIPAQEGQNHSHLLSCIKQAIGLIRSQSDRELSLDETAAFAGLSKYYFAREFRRVTGHTFVSYLNLIRCEKAKALLLEDQLSIGAVGRTCGFANQSYFTRVFRAYTGVCPGEYREEYLLEKEQQSAKKPK